MTDRVFYYVRHSDVDARKADGWVVADDLQGIHHGAYAVMMERPADAKVVQIVVTKTKSGALRMVEFSSSAVLETREFTQVEVAMMFLRKAVDALSVAEEAANV